MANIITNAKFHVIEKAGHEINVVASKKLADTMKLFYKKNKINWILT